MSAVENDPFLSSSNKTRVSEQVDLLFCCLSSTNTSLKQGEFLPVTHKNEK